MASTSIISPMLGKAGNLEDVTNDEWIMEPKYDGFRMVAVVTHSTVEGVDCWIGRNSAHTENVPYIQQALAEAVPAGTILDGELYSPEKGWGHTSGVIKRKKPHDLKTHGPALQFAIFDVIQWEGEDCREMTFAKRRELLEREIPKGLLTAPGGVLRRSPTMPSTMATFEEMVDLGLEGVMAKRKSGTYRSGRRSPDLIKIKVQNTVDVVVTEIYPGEPGSWIEQENLPGKLGFAYFGEDEMGRVGTGFRKADREHIRDHKDEWLGQVIEVGHMTVDKGTALRHPAFVRRREDKKPEQATRQTESKPTRVAPGTKTKAKKKPDPVDEPGYVDSPMKSATGHWRSIHAMKDDKLLALQAEMVGSKDTEGAKRLTAELSKRGI